MASVYDTYEVEEPRQHKHRHHKDREPRYVETKETYVRGSAPLAATLSPDAAYQSRNRDLVRQPMRQESDMSIEEVRRDFPPPSGASYAAQRTLVREDRYGRGDRDGDYYDSRRRSYNDLNRKSRRDVVEEKTVVERPRSLTRNQKIIAAVGGAALAVGGKELWDRRQASSNFDGEPRPARNPMATAAVGAAGAFAGYEGAEFYAKKYMKKEKEKVKSIKGHHDYTSSDDEGPRHKKDRRGSSSSDDGKKKKKDGKKDKDKDKEPDKQAKIQQSAKAALLAGAYEAFRVRNEPGTWNGEKGKRILTAAIGAGGIDAAADRNPQSDSSKRHILEAVVGGLAGNRLINGSRKEVVADEATGRSTSRARSRSRAASRARGDDADGANGGGLGALAAAGIAGLAGSKLLSRSRSRARKDSDSDSDDSRSRGKGDSRKRSKSVTDYARKGLAALGLGEVASKASNDRDRDRDRDDESVYRGSSRRAPSRDPYGDDRYADSRSSLGGRNSGGRNGRRAGDYPDSDTESLGSSSGDERRIKKMKGKQILTTGLATVATIHAAHNIYLSMEKRDARHKAVAEGEMTPEEARKLKAKATLQDTASVGIAALGIKGAISEIKDANEVRHECADFNEKRAIRHEKRMARIQQQKAASSSSRYSSSLEYGSDRSDQNYNRRRIEPRRPGAGDEPRGGPHYQDANPYAARLPPPPGNPGYNGVD